MSSLLAFILLASTSTGSVVHTTKAINTPVIEPALVEVPKSPNGLTLYNHKGEVVARCGKKDDSFSDCKMEPGVTLDDLMNAWVNAYQEMQK
ncbi:MAG TPA: hypothetical protein VGG85_02720 [Terracidiphilus sp.]|jgi:hypothetical protein